MTLVSINYSAVGTGSPTAVDHPKGVSDKGGVSKGGVGTKGVHEPKGVHLFFLLVDDCTYNIVHFKPFADQFNLDNSTFACHARYPSLIKYVKYSRSWRSWRHVKLPGKSPVGVAST